MGSKSVPRREKLKRCMKFLQEVKRMNTDKYCAVLFTPEGIDKSTNEYTQFEKAIDQVLNKFNQIMENKNDPSN